MSLFDSRAHAAMEDVEKDYKEPIAELMGQNELSARAVGAFLISRHARERNDQIKARFGRDNGSGLDDAGIQAIEQEFLQQSSIEQL
jgi:hypothetical protein